MMDDSDDVSHLQRVFATFNSSSSAIFAHPYFYLLQTNSKWSLCLLSGLPPSIYSALLLKCKVVKIKGNVAMLDNKQWDVFQTSTGLRGDSYGRGGCMELTNARIEHAALFERGEDENTTVSKLDVIRISRVESGKPPPSNTAINNGVEPPQMARAMREVKDCLREATMSLSDGHETKKNDVLDVEQWLIMKTSLGRPYFYLIQFNGWKRNERIMGGGLTINNNQPHGQMHSWHRGG